MSTEAIIGLILMIIATYFIGNISFAIILSKAKKKDITKMGSGNPGTMNMLRNFGAKLGVLTLVLDALKSAIPCLIAWLIFTPHGFGYEALYAVGIACILGHMYPVTRKFKGGKGMASALGVFIVANPLWTIACFVVAFVYLYFFDYGAIASFLVLSTMAVLQGISPQTSLISAILIFVIFALVIFAHRGNIGRLMMGNEGKVHLKKTLKKIGMKKTRKEKSQEKKEEKKRDIG